MNANNSSNYNQLKDIEEKIKKAQKQKYDLEKSIEFAKKVESRKQRAHRLIQTGALAEKYFQIHNLDMGEREKLFKTFSNFIIANKPTDLKNKF